MNESIVPKWQRELRAFLGIKKGVILEGNVYDEFPTFEYHGDDYEFFDIDILDNTISSLVNFDETDVFFFDPIDGFYCDARIEGNETEVEAQRKKMMPLFEGYNVSEITKNHGCKVCLMPVNKGKGTPDDSSGRYVWVSEIVRRAMADKSPYTKKENILFVLNFASRLEPCTMSEAEANAMFLNLMAATTATQSNNTIGNTFIMVVDKYNDIPAWVYLNNPNMRTVSISVPDRGTRRLFLENLGGELSQFQQLSDENYAEGTRFVAETEGLQLQEMRQVLQLALKMRISCDDIDHAFKLYKYGVSDDPWENLETDILDKVKNTLTGRVKGQDEAIAKVQTVAARAVKGLSGLQHSGASHKPKGILFFAGPTGVGKTETAKALAEAIFGDENAYIRFDMSEYRQEQSDQKLFGAPPGYVGYEGGGQLTNAIKARPFSVVLFDEIEKASPTILDKFLQILEDGRMTDNQGNTVYFGESIIIFTSNIGLTKEDDKDIRSFMGSRPRRIPTITIEDPMKEDTEEFRNKVQDTLYNGVKDYFTDIGRPELLNRIGLNNIVVFQFINVDGAKSICDYKLGKICNGIKSEKNIEIHTEDIKEFLHQKAVAERADGGRGVGNMLEREFLNPLSNFLCSQDKMPSVLRCHLVDGKVEFEVMMSED